MKHTDLWSAYRALDQFAAEELIAAVNAHGGEYVFYDKKHDDPDTVIMPWITASWKHCETGDFYVTRVVVDEGKYLTIYGVPVEDVSATEDYLDYIAPGQIGDIIDFIPETNDVKDVSQKIDTEIIISAMKNNQC